MATYYVYISDAKVDMLLGSIPERAKKKLALELKINAAVLTLKFAKSLESTQEEHRVPRLLAALKHLRETDHVGTLASPGSYIEDIANLAYDRYATAPSPIVGDLNGSAVLFGGALDQQELAMVGSSSHLVLQQPQPSKQPPSSDLPAIVRLLDAMVAVERGGGASNHGGVAAERVIANARTCIKDLLEIHPTQSCEFMAKRLLVRGGEGGSGGSWTMTLASPLYVALAR